MFVFGLHTESVFERNDGRCDAITSMEGNKDQGFASMTGHDV